MGAARWCWLAVLVAACGTPRRASEAGDARLLDPGRRAQRAASEAALEPAFEALAAALRDGEEPNARAILARIQALRPDGTAAEVAAAYERVLDGRDAARAVALRLVVRGRPDREGRRRLALAAVSGHAAPVVVRAAAARLESSLFGIDARGFEHRSATTRPVEALAELRLEPDAPEIHDLVDFGVPLSNEIAVRARFELVLVQAEIELDGRRLPAATLAVEPCEVDELAPFLPRAEVEPAELARHLERPGFSLPAALERAVRIAPERRREALDACAPVLARLNRVDLERAAPCLRWLSGDRERGADPDRWRAWAEESVRRAEPAPVLDLPERGRETPPPSEP